MLKNLMASSDFVLDLGNNNTLIRDKEQILFSQPTCIVVNENKSTYAVGEKAHEMYERTHDGIKAIKPLRGGVIADYEYAVQMLREMVFATFPESKWLKRFRHIVSGVPYSTSEVEKRALRDALGQFNARHAQLVYEPLAAALGMGLDVTQPDGKCVVDIGGGITEIVIISLSGIVSHESIHVSGNTLTEDVQDHFRKNYNLAIGFHMAERAKIEVGSALREDQDQKWFKVVGKNMISGIPSTQEISNNEMAEVLDKSISKIEESIGRTLEMCPPELSSDIFENGLHLTGGGALLHGLTERLEKKFDLPVHLAASPQHSVSKGLSQILKDTKKHRAILMD